MSLLTAYTIHNASQKYSPETAEDRQPDKPCFAFSEQERASFISHMTSGAEQLVRSSEETVLERTQEVLDSQGQLESVLKTESSRLEAARPDLLEIQRIMNKVPTYRNKINQLKKDMVSVHRRCAKLSSKAEHLRGTRDRIIEGDRAQAARLAKLEARVVTTTPNPGILPAGSSKSAHVDD